jgi:hypothetical protein
MRRLIAAALWDWALPMGCCGVVLVGLIGCACFGSVLGMRPRRAGQG